jgi:putative transposase
VDHAQLGILLIREGGEAARPWLTIVIDDYSRAIAGYYLGFDPPSSMRTALALRQDIWRKGHPHWHICGIPEVLYTDNGSDFTSKHIEQVAVDLKTRLVFSTPGKPQGRGRIERFFRTVNQMFLCELDGYIKRKRRKPSLTLDRFEEHFRTFLLETYNRRTSIEGRPAPSERWEAGGFIPRMPDSLEQLDLLLMQEAHRARRLMLDTTGCKLIPGGFGCLARLKLGRRLTNFRDIAIYSVTKPAWKNTWHLAHDWGACLRGSRTRKHKYR